MIERSRRDGSQISVDFRLQMPDGSVKYMHVFAHIRDAHGQPEYIAAVQDVTAAPALRRRARPGSIGTRACGQGHEARTSDGVDRPRSQPAAFGHHHERQHLSADAGRRSAQFEGARETARRTIRDGNRASEVITRLRALFSRKEPTAKMDLNEATQEVIALSWSELQRNRVIAAAGTCRRPSVGYGRSCPAAAGHPEPDP